MGPLYLSWGLQSRWEEREPPRSVPGRWDSLEESSWFGADFSSEPPDAPVRPLRCRGWGGEPRAAFSPPRSGGRRPPRAGWNAPFPVPRWQRGGRGEASVLLPGGRRPLCVRQRGGWRRRAAGHGRALRADGGGGPRDGGLRAGGHPGGRAGRGPQNKGVAAGEPRGSTRGWWGGPAAGAGTGRGAPRPSVAPPRSSGRAARELQPGLLHGPASVRGARQLPAVLRLRDPQVLHPHLQPALLLLRRPYARPVWFPHFQSSWECVGRF